MAKRFEDLDVWKVGRELANLIYGYGRETAIAKDYGFKDQIQRAAVSVMNNIAEGFERGSNKDFSKFLFIARGSVGEIRSMLYLALDQKYISEDQFKEAYNLCVRDSQLCWGLIKHLQKTSGWNNDANSRAHPLLTILTRCKAPFQRLKRMKCFNEARSGVSTIEWSDYGTEFKNLYSRPLGSGWRRNLARL